MNREEQLKQAIDESVRMGINIASDGYRTSKYSSNFSPQKNIETAMSDISILRHADPEIMKAAGWVREEELQPIASVPDLLKECPTCDSKSMGIFIYPQTLKVNEVDVSANYTVVKCLECNREFTTDEIDEININNFKQSADKLPKQ